MTALEYELFSALRQKVTRPGGRPFRPLPGPWPSWTCCAPSPPWRSSNRYVLPTVDDTGVIDIREGRHPVVEKVLKDACFVPNDTYMDGRDDTASPSSPAPTWPVNPPICGRWRSSCLMAQIGCFVPAQCRTSGVVDRVFTRMGASDDLSAGQSTFMVEMSEVADILKHATGNSLLILDEIGRGTSTFDGMSIARAVLEYCAGAKSWAPRPCLPPTTTSSPCWRRQLPGVKNYNIAVKKKGDDIIFLRKIVRGGADQSYGIEVAKLAGVPEPVIAPGQEPFWRSWKTAKASPFRIPGPRRSRRKRSRCPCWIWAPWSAPSASAPWISTPSPPSRP